MPVFNALPENYIEKGSLDLSKSPRIAIWLNLVAVVLLALSSWLFWRALVWLRPQEAPGIFSLQSVTIPQALLFILKVLVITGVMLGVHEALHGVFFWVFTRTLPIFGIGPGYAYAAAPGWYLPRNRYLAVGLAPLVLISLAGLLLLAVVPPAWLMVVIIFAVLNISGAVGDLAVAAWLLSLPATCLANDRGDAVTLYVLATVEAKSEDRPPL